MFTTARVTLTPILEFLRPIPPIAWIPISIILFGIGDPSAYFVIFVGAFFPILTNTARGVSEVSPVHLDAAKSLGASRFRCFGHVLLPSALPNIFTGLRIGLGFAWMCVIAAEMIAAQSGIGYEIQLNRQLLELDKVVAGMVTIGVVGLVSSSMMAQLEWLSLPWRRSGLKKASSAFQGDKQGATTYAWSQALSIGSYLTKPSSDYNSNDTAPDVLNNQGSPVEVEDLQFEYISGTPVITNFNLEVKAGEAFCILGKSGVGKTTFLRILAGLELPLHGSIFIGDVPLEKYKDRISMVFQGSGLFPWKTAIENIEFAISGQDHAQSKRIVAAKFLELVGLSEKADAYPHQLSGGQQQRIGVARALAKNPTLLLMDEPFGALDSLTRESLQEGISHLLASDHMTVLLVTHDISEALFMSDRVAVMTNKGSLVGEVTVKSARPRDSNFRHSLEFNQLREKLWATLHQPN